jgi:hypothetical protein
MKVTYTLSNWRGKKVERDLREGIAGVRGCMAEVTRLRLNNSRVAWLIGYLRALPMQASYHVREDGRLDATYDFYTIDPRDAETFIGYLRAKKYLALRATRKPADAEVEART